MCKDHDKTRGFLKQQNNILYFTKFDNLKRFIYLPNHKFSHTCESFSFVLFKTLFINRICSMAYTFFIVSSLNRIHIIRLETKHPHNKKKCVITQLYQVCVRTYTYFQVCEFRKKPSLV